MLATGNGYHITVLLLCYLSKIINFNSNELIFDLLILEAVFAYWNVIALRNEFIFIDIDAYLYFPAIILQGSYR